MPPIIKPPIWRVNQGQRLSNRIAFYSVFPGGNIALNAVDGRKAATATLAFASTPYGQAINASTEAGAPSWPLAYAPIKGTGGNGSGDYTLLVVANPPTGVASYLFSQRNNASPDFSQVALITNFVIPQATSSGALCLFCDDESAGGTGIDYGAYTNTTAIDGKWHVYIAGCRNGSYFIYVDGVPNLASQTAPSTHHFITSNQPTLRVGGPGAATGTLANCNIAVAGSWNRALSGDEIQALTRDPWLPLRPNWASPNRVLFAASGSASPSLSVSGILGSPIGTASIARGEAVSPIGSLAKPDGTTSLKLGNTFSSVAGTFARPVGSASLKRGAAISAASVLPRPAAHAVLVRGTAASIAGAIARPNGSAGINVGVVVSPIKGTLPLPVAAASLSHGTGRSISMVGKLAQISVQAGLLQGENLHVHGSLPGPRGSAAGGIGETIAAGGRLPRPLGSARLTQPADAVDVSGLLSLPLGKAIVLTARGAISESGRIITIPANNRTVIVSPDVRTIQVPEIVEII